MGQQINAENVGDVRSIIIKKEQHIAQHVEDVRIAVNVVLQVIVAVVKFIVLN